MWRSIGPVVLTVVMVAACGDSTPAGSSLDTAATSAPEAPTTTAAASGVVAVGVAPCDLLTADEVAAATGLEVESLVEDGAITCVFDLGAEAGVDVFITADDGQGRMGGPAAVFENYMALVPEGEAETVAGLGERAVYAAGFRGLAVDAGGGRYIGLGVNGGFQQLAEPRDVLITLAMAALARL
jgi:hypothetical protein